MDSDLDLFSNDAEFSAVPNENQEETCPQCHKNIRAELMRQSHHPIREGKTKCSDCHNAHGTIADKLVDARSADQML